MKNLFVVLAITLILSDVVETDNGKTICIYSNSQREESVTIDSGKCKHTMTFETEE